MANRHFLIMNQMDVPVCCSVSLRSRRGTVTFLPPDVRADFIALPGYAKRIDLEPGDGPDPLTKADLAKYLTVDVSKAPQRAVFRIGIRRSSGELVVTIQPHPHALN